MIPLAPPLRLAHAEDAAALARLVNYAGEGLPLHLWTQMAGPGEDPWAVGARRQAVNAAEGEAVVVDGGAGAVAGLTGYLIGADPQPTDDMPAMFVPLQEREDQALESWYVNVLAALPEARGRSTRLLGVADQSRRPQALRAAGLCRGCARRHGQGRLAERRDRMGASPEGHLTRAAGRAGNAEKHRERPAHGA